MRRLEFQSPSDNRLLRSAQLYLLDWLVSKSHEHNLLFWLDFGTLLGAYRSGRFIPWDDDIDVSMAPESLARLLNLDLSDSDVFVQSKSTDPAFKENYVKLRLRDSLFVEHNESSAEHYHQGIYLDIFPTYEYPKLPKPILQYLIRLYYAIYHSQPSNPFKRTLAFAIFLAVKPMWRLLSILPSALIGLSPPDNRFATLSSKSTLYPLSSISFEGKSYPCPCNTPTRLLDLYGESFNQPLPLDERIRHSREIYISDRWSSLGSTNCAS